MSVEARQDGGILKSALSGVMPILRGAKRWYWKSSVRDLGVGLISARSPARAAIAGSHRFVLFLVPGVDFVNGGIMSICSIANETAKLKEIHGSEVLVCTAAGEPRLRHFTKFDNDVEVHSFTDVLRWLPPNSKVLVHTPEVHTEEYVPDAASYFLSRKDIAWQFNILLQNIDLIPSADVVTQMKKIGPVTATTALALYATQETADRLGCPVHPFTTFVWPENYPRVDYAEKHKTIVISPDECDSKTQIVAALRAALPDHKIIEIRNMTYRQYRRIIKHAKFTFTFGEGLDGYFVETIFSGGVGLAIYNDRFFGSKYQSLDGVFGDDAAAISTVAEFIGRANHASTYEEISSRQFAAVSKDFVKEAYLGNLRAFYEKFFRA